MRSKLEAFQECHSVLCFMEAGDVLETSLFGLQGKGPRLSFKEGLGYLRAARKSQTQANCCVLVGIEALRHLGVHHNLGKKHVYSKKHQGIVKNVLAKYLKKINEAKQYLKKPEVHDLLWEDGAKVWCYFCAQEIEKHSRNADTALSIRSHNFLLHLATPAHEAACKSFFWKNKVSKSAVPQYVISSTLIAKAEPAITAAEKAYLAKMDRLHQQTVAVIQNMDRQRTDLVTKARIEVCSG